MGVVHVNGGQCDGANPDCCHKHYNCSVQEYGHDADPFHFIVAALLLLGTSVGAHAQITGTFGDQGPILDRVDLVWANLAANRLLRSQPAPLGTAETWAEPTSGDSGTLTMERAYRSKGRNCRTVGWHDVFKSGAERTFHLDTCLVAGHWSLM